MQNHLQRWLSSDEGSERADGRTEEKTDLTFTYFTTPENLSDALEGLKLLAKKLSQPVGLFIYIGSAYTEDQLFHLKKTLQACGKKPTEVETHSFWQGKRGIRACMGRGVQEDRRS